MLRMPCCPLSADRLRKYALDMVSLFPQNTFKGRKNGLRADLAQTLADLHPRFVRFPGGCVAHGDGVDNIYDWKGSIGALEERKPLRNLWGYHQTRGLGYHEYFLFCEDMGAEPVPVVAAGVPCQNSGTCSHHSVGELGCGGQQGGIPSGGNAAVRAGCIGLDRICEWRCEEDRMGKEACASRTPQAL